VGKRADRVVLDRNLFEADRYDIHTARHLTVWLDGRQVHGEISQP